MNVKKGDRATIIDSLGGKMIGKTVSVIEYCGEHSKYGHMWLVESDALESHTVWGAKWGIKPSAAVVGNQCHCADSWLRKIEDPLDTKSIIRETELINKD